MDTGNSSWSRTDHSQPFGHRAYIPVVSSGWGTRNSVSDRRADCNESHEGSKQTGDQEKLEEGALRSLGREASFTWDIWTETWKRRENVCFRWRRYTARLEITWGHQVSRRRPVESRVHEQEAGSKGWRWKKAEAIMGVMGRNQISFSVPVKPLTWKLERWRRKWQPTPVFLPG